MSMTPGWYEVPGQPGTTAWWDGAQWQSAQPGRPAKAGRPMIVAAAFVAIAAIGATATWTALRPRPFTVRATAEVRGEDCSYAPYADLRTIVVTNPSGEEVGYADLRPDVDEMGFCRWTGEVTVSDASDYYLVSSRSTQRAPLRMSHTQVELLGIHVSVGSCDDAPSGSHRHDSCVAATSG